jgi:hypothetical protein
LGCRGGEFTVPDLRAATDIPVTQIQVFVDSLVAERYLARRKDDQRVHFTLMKDTGRQAPLVGAVYKLRDVLWRTMKNLSRGGDFSFADLAINARIPGVPVNEGDARRYTLALKKAKYVVETSPHRFRLIENTGDAAPVVQRLGTIFDPNRNEIVWTAEPGL